MRRRMKRMTARCSSGLVCRAPRTNCIRLDGLTGDATLLARITLAKRQGRRRAISPAFKHRERIRDLPSFRKNARAMSIGRVVVCRVDETKELQDTAFLMTYDGRSSRRATQRRRRRIAGFAEEMMKAGVPLVRAACYRKPRHGSSARAASLTIPTGHSPRPRSSSSVTRSSRSRIGTRRSRSLGAS